MGNGASVNNNSSVPSSPTGSMGNSTSSIRRGSLGLFTQDEKDEIALFAAQKENSMKYIAKEIYDDVPIKVVQTRVPKRLYQSQRSKSFRSPTQSMRSRTSSNRSNNNGNGGSPSSVSSRNNSMRSTTTHSYGQEKEHGFINVGELKNSSSNISQQQYDEEQQQQQSTTRSSIAFDINKSNSNSNKYLDNNNDNNNTSTGLPPTGAGTAYTNTNTTATTTTTTTTINTTTTNTTDINAADNDDDEYEYNNNDNMNMNNNNNNNNLNKRKTKIQRLSIAIQQGIGVKPPVDEDPNEEVVEDRKFLIFSIDSKLLTDDDNKMIRDAQTNGSGSYPEDVGVDDEGNIYINIMSNAGKKKVRKILAPHIHHVTEVPLIPEPPFCLESNPTSLTIGWEPPFETPFLGQIDKFQIQYRKENDIQWYVMLLKDWRKNADLSYRLTKLHPWTTYYFRVKCANTQGWGEYSEISEGILTKPDKPMPPNPPIGSHITTDRLMLHWLPPSSNGSDIIGFSIRSKKPGEEYNILYEGPLMDYLILGLEPNEIYSFEVAAINEVGTSRYSIPYTIRIPLAASVKPLVNVDGIEQEIPEGVLRRGDLWLECWDPEGERIFYFNRITGKRETTPPKEFVSWKEQQGKPKEENDPVIIFRKKRFHFFKNLKKRASQAQGPRQKGIKHLEIKVRRDKVLEDSMQILMTMDPNDYYKKTKVIFEGEEGIDSGGLTKDWYLLLSRELRSPKLRLVKTTESNLIEIDTYLGPSPERLKYFRFMGIILAKAMYDKAFVDLPFCNITYKKLLKENITLQDLEDMDPALVKSLIWMRENPIENILFETFSVVKPGPNGIETVDLMDNGDDTDVTDDNKEDYIKLMVEYRSSFSIQTEFNAICRGIKPIMEVDELKKFDADELELLWNGKREINVDEIRAYTIFQGTFTDQSTIVLWLWQAVNEFDDARRRKFLRFVTGTDRIPLDGFEPSFNLTEGQDMDTEALPRAHTCFNQLVIPNYENYIKLKTKLIFACENTEGFGMT